MKNVKAFLKNITFGISISFAAAPRYFRIKCILILFTTFLPLLMLWIWKEILNLVIYGNDKAKTVECLAIYLAIRLMSYAVYHVDQYINKRYSDELRFYIDKVMMDKTAKMDYVYFDMSSIGDKILRTRSNLSIVTEVTWTVFSLVSALINIISVVTAITIYQWRIGLVIAALMIPYGFLTADHSKKLVQIEREQTNNKRKMDYIKECFNNADCLFEIKANSLTDPFLSRFKEAWRNVFEQEKRENTSFALGSLCIELIGLLGILFIFICVTADVIAGSVGIGDLQYYLELTNRFREQIRELIAKMNDIIANDERLIELQEFMSLRTEEETSSHLKLVSNPEIEFRDVYFKYPNSEQYVLNGCSFKIEKNTKVALIGLNGAGKSTIINLLFGFYTPESGEILINGEEMCKYDIKSVRKIFSVLFQDYITYSLPIREIISFADFDARYDEKRLEKACKISGADKILAHWKEGINSIVGRYYADGYDMSGGQWQIVGLARAYFAERKFMILDEPSAALDPYEEDRIFRQLFESKEENASITISHRLSNAILTDHILVLSEGKIVEQGAHHELMDLHGEYEKLFSLQAQKYT